MPSRFKIAEYWRERQTQFDCELTQEIDFDELCCFACGSKKTLERAHIIGRQFDGSNELSNLILLCRFCHRRCPDVNDRDEVFSWVNHQVSEVRRFYDLVRAALKAANLDQKDMQALSSVLQSKTVENIVDDLVALSGVHHGVKESTVQSSLTVWLKRQVK